MAFSTKLQDPASYGSSIDFSEPADREELIQTVDHYVDVFQEIVRKSIGYPRNWLVDKFIIDQVAKFLPYGVHNVGDWEAGSQFAPEGMDFEREVMEFIYEMFKCAGGAKNFWGDVDDSGTTGNLWAITVGKTVLRKRNNNVDPVIVYSKDGHYSFKTGVLNSGLPAEEVATNQDGSIKIDALKATFARYPNRPIFMGIMNGTTVKEGRDDIIAVLQAAKATGRPREHFYFHVDGAYSSVYLRLIDAPAKITPSFDHDIDSISASGHKFIGSQRTTGLLVMRKEHSEAVKSDVEYISSVNKTMGGSRDAFPIIELWLAIKYRGKKQMEEWARACILKARGVAQTMRDAGVKDVLLNEYATTVYFRQPSKALMDKYHLAPEGDNCHLIVEPHTLSEFGGYGSLDEFMVEFLAELR